MRASKATNRKINMCDTCGLIYPTCHPEIIEFGDGIGNDNVIVCSSYLTKKIHGDDHIELAPEIGIFKRDISDTFGIEG